MKGGFIMRGVLLLVFFVLLFGSSIIYGQNGSIYNGSTNELYQNNGERNGPALITFKIIYALQQSDGSIYLRVNPSVLEDNRGKGYYYKGVEYFGNLIPEVNQIEVKTLNLSFDISNATTGNISKNITVTIGGDNSLLGINSALLIGKAPEGFYDVVTTVRVKVNTITTKNYEVAHSAIEKYLNKKKQEEQAKADLEKYNGLLTDGKRLFDSGSYDEAIGLFRKALNIKVSNNEAQAWIDKAKAKKEQEQTVGNTNASSGKNSTGAKDKTNSDHGNSGKNTSQEEDFWGYNSTNTTERTKSKEELQAEKNRKAIEDLNNRMENDRKQLEERNKKIEAEFERKRAIASSNYYINESRTNAEQGLSMNSKFDRSFDSIEELQAAFMAQSQAINDNAMQLSDAKLQQNANSLEYYFGNSTGADRAIGEFATGIANLISQAEAEKERKEAQERLKKERDAQMARIEAERKARILQLRKDIIQQFPEGGVPLSRHRVEVDELYFFTYRYDGGTRVQVSNVFPIGKFKDDTWMFKDKVKYESEKVIGGSVTLVGYYTTQEMAEKERNVFITLLPKAEVQVSSYSVKGRKWEGVRDGSSTEFWGKEVKNESGNSESKTEDFWGTGNKEMKEKKEEKKNDSFWD